MPGACDACVSRTWLVARMAGHIERARTRLEEVLRLEDDELIAAVGGRSRDRVREELAALDVGELRARSHAAGLETICRCDPDYPPALFALPAPPAVLHVAGGLGRLLELSATDPVAIVGSRRASDYGLDVARSLGRSVAVAGIPVVSGMALGIDSAAHAGALDVAGPTVAVLPGRADRPYPAGKRVLHRRIVAGGAAVSELGPGTSVWRWMFLARNRIIAALAAMTVVVEAGERSGAMVTARVAREIGRPVGAVPGRVTSPYAAGANALLASGACVVRGAQDVLDCVFGAGVRLAGAGGGAGAGGAGGADGAVAGGGGGGRGAGAAGRRDAPPELRPLLDAIAAGHETTAALDRAGFGPEQGLAALAALELGGFVRRGAGGRFSVVP
jgi:DNA processing protein